MYQIVNQKTKIMKKMYVFAAVLQALWLTACSSEETLSDGTLKVIAGIGGTESGTITRSIVSGTGFPDAATIGIFVTGTDYTSNDRTFTYDDGVSDGTADWTGDDAIYLTKNTATVYGYYPSSLTPTISGTSSTVPATVLTTIATNGFDAASEDATVLDYMYAVGTGDGTAQETVTKDASAATLTFKHALAQLVFIVKKAAEFGGTGTLTNITLTQPSGSYFNGGSTAGTMALTGGTLTLPATDNTINLTDSKLINESGASAATATVFVAPASATSISLSMTIDGSTYSLASGSYLPTGTSGSTFTGWEAGKTYTYTITVAGGALSLSNTAVTITDWTSFGTIDGSTIQ